MSILNFRNFISLLSGQSNHTLDNLERTSRLSPRPDSPLQRRSLYDSRSSSSQSSRPIHYDQTSKLKHIQRKQGNPSKPRPIQQRQGQLKGRKSMHFDQLPHSFGHFSRKDDTSRNAIPMSPQSYNQGNFYSEAGSRHFDDIYGSSAQSVYESKQGRRFGASYEKYNHSSTREARKSTSHRSFSDWIKDQLTAHSYSSSHHQFYSRSKRNSRDISRSVYPLTSNWIHLETMDQVHYHLKHIFDGNYTAPITAPQSILDVGTGSGAWLLEMATEFPEAQCVGVDISAVQPSEIIPPNCRFDVIDVLQGLPYADESFDFVHVRFLEMGIPTYEWPFLLDELHRVCAPGGYIEIIATDNIIHGGGPICRLLNEWHEQVLATHDVDIHIVDQLASLLAEDIGSKAIQSHKPVALAVADGSTPHTSLSRDGQSIDERSDDTAGSFEPPTVREVLCRLHDQVSHGTLESSLTPHSRQNSSSEYSFLSGPRFEQVASLRLRFSLNPVDGIHSRMALEARQSLTYGYQEQLREHGISTNQIKWTLDAMLEEVNAFHTSMDILVITGRRPLR